jgi:hypothetical protein
MAPPDFRTFTCFFAQAHLDELSPLKRAERLLLQDVSARTDGQKQAIKAILRNARQIEGSLTHRIFQELVLGSRVFTQVYRLPSALDTDSYLLRHDRMALSEQGRAKLIHWLRDGDHRAAIFTSRPSRAPLDHMSTPEAEIGAQGAGLEMLPIAGLGGLSWLSAQRSYDPEAFLKPSPVHTLAALRLSLSDSLEGALKGAAALVLDDQVDRTWGALHGAQVYVFEDTVSGLKSILAAEETLRGFGVAIEISLFGITDREAKRQSLESYGATVCPTLSVALDGVPGF